jgi:hypothetical protein
MVSRIRSIVNRARAVAANLPAMHPSRLHRVLRLILIVLLISTAVVALLVGGFFFWRDHRPQPENTRVELFDGITYIRDVRQQPRPLVIHVVQIDLDTPGLSFLVTPGQPVNGHEVRAQTTSQFLAQHDLQLAINGDFFWPWWYHTLFDYYPHDNDPTDVNGFAASNGAVYSEEKADDPRPTLFLSQANRAGIDQPIGAVYNAISGLPLIVDEGQVSDQIKPDEYYAGVHPRSAVGLDREKRTLLLFIVDGRQPNYSEGVTLPELAQIAIEYGADIALNLDGGGSSTLVIEDAQGRPQILNSPIHASIPGMERPVGNHLGVWVR